jgi:hypothetical protein
MMLPPMLPYNEPPDGYMLTTDGTNMSWEPIATPADISAKCPCCGSRQFVTRHARRICTYCRSEQDGEPMRETCWPEKLLSTLRDKIAFLKDINSQYDVQFGAAVLRPETVVRIKEVP